MCHSFTDQNLNVMEGSSQGDFKSGRETNTFFQINEEERNMWKLFGKEVSRSALVFIFQVTILYISIITCFVNLTVRNGPVELWITILSLSLGSILPSPKVKKGSINGSRGLLSSNTPSVV